MHYTAMLVITAAPVVYIERALAARVWSGRELRGVCESTSSLTNSTSACQPAVSVAAMGCRKSKTLSENYCTAESRLRCLISNIQFQTHSIPAIN